MSRQCYMQRTAMHSNCQQYL